MGTDRVNNDMAAEEEKERSGRREKEICQTDLALFCIVNMIPVVQTG